MVDNNLLRSASGNTFRRTTKWIHLVAADDRDNKSATNDLSSDECYRRPRDKARMRARIMRVTMTQMMMNIFFCNGMYDVM